MAPWDGGVKFGTWSSILITLLIYGGLLWIEEARSELGGHMIIWVALLSFSACYIFAPRSYLIGKDGVAIERIVGPIFIPYAQILSLQIVERANLRRAVGNGGVFGYYGTYVDGSGTKVKVYATRFKGMVRIETTDRTYYLSPNEPGSFVEAVKQHLT